MQPQTMTRDARSRAIDAAMGRIEKMFGKGALMRMDGAAVGAVPVIPTGSVSVDLALGVGGIPRGRVTEIYGPESSGKTTLALHVIAEAQKAGGTCAFIDAEHALDVTYASKLGVDVPALLVSQPDHGEQALEITDTLVRSGGVELVVIDSVAALTPRSEVEGDMGDNHVGLQARLMSQAMRKLTAAAARTGTAIVFINQLRMKIGTMFGSPETTTGGRALKFYSTVRIDIRRIGSIKDKDEVVGNKTKIRIQKNKLAPPFRYAEVELRFGAGICPVLDLLEKAIELGLVTRAGSWLTLGKQRQQGRDAMRKWLIENPEPAGELRSKVLERLGIGVPMVSEAVAEA